MPIGGCALANLRESFLMRSHGRSVTIDGIGGDAPLALCKSRQACTIPAPDGLVVALPALVMGYMLYLVMQQAGFPEARLGYC